MPPPLSHLDESNNANMLLEIMQPICDPLPLQKIQKSISNDNDEQKPTLPTQLSLTFNISSDGFSTPLVINMIPNTYTTSSPKLHLAVLLQKPNTMEILETQVLLDSGTKSAIMAKSFAEEKEIQTELLNEPIPVYNADGTLNTIGSITRKATMVLDYQGHREKMDFLIADITEKAILGLRWLQNHNPNVDWITGKITFANCPLTCQTSPMNDKEEINHTSISARIAPNRDDETREVPESYQDFTDRFISTGEIKKLPNHKPYDHQIHLKPDVEPYAKRKSWLYTQEEKDTFRKWVKEYVQLGMIRKTDPAKAEWVAPTLAVGRKGSKELRPCIDYRGLNERTIKDRFPLPDIRDILMDLGETDAKIFTSLDIRNGYHNIRIAEGEEHLAAFITPDGYYEPLVMMFGLCNAPATFQRMMNDLFHIQIEEGKIKCYLDDILIFSHSLDEH
jgi:hypothetical protein